MPKPQPSLIGARERAVVYRIRKSKCQIGWRNRKDCYLNTAAIDTWCHPCLIRWANRKDAARFVAPVDDVVPSRC